MKGKEMDKWHVSDLSQIVKKGESIAEPLFAIQSSPPDFKEFGRFKCSRHEAEAMAKQLNRLENNAAAWQEVIDFLGKMPIPINISMKDAAAFGIAVANIILKYSGDNIINES